jgi:hypothetical protein
MVALGLAPTWSQAGFLSSASQSYGPTAPNGYMVRIDPQMATLAHSQHQDIQVTVQSAQGEPVEGVEVHFRPSEGTVTTKPGSGKTRDGVVQGTFAAGMGGDQPRTAHVLVRVENVEVTVFIDIVPAVFGR